jgi:hypothetical protein
MNEPNEISREPLIRWLVQLVFALEADLGKYFRETGLYPEVADEGTQREVLDLAFDVGKYRMLYQYLDQLIRSQSDLRLVQQRVDDVLPRIQALEVTRNGAVTQEDLRHISSRISKVEAGMPSRLHIFVWTMAAIFAITGFVAAILGVLNYLFA